jgi:hypothetical protein
MATDRTICAACEGSGEKGYRGYGGDPVNDYVKPCKECGGSGQKPADIATLRQALRLIIENSGPDIAYSWGQIKLKECHAIAREALGLTDEDEQ